MFGYVNKITLMGNLGADPEIRRTNNGVPIARFRVATSEFWKDKHSGERRSSTEWHTVVIFGNLALVAEKQLKKGMKVYLEGQQRTRKWDDDKGVTRFTTEVVLDGRQAVLEIPNAPERQDDDANLPDEAFASRDEYDEVPL